jgi:DNA processing protein
VKAPAKDPLGTVPEAAYWVGFSRIEGIGPSKTRRLHDHFGSLTLAWTMPVSALIDAGIDARTAETIGQTRRAIDLEGEMARLERTGVQVICWNDSGYPRLLRHIVNPPATLYVSGELTSADDIAVAIVGTRGPTSYGRQVAQKLAGDLASKGVTIVSGLARGIDAEAHRAALEAGGRTIAVLGSGLDVIYPREHAGLARQIARGVGAVMSDYPLGTKPDAVHFPARNRIVSGLTLGTVVIEAGETSGALITARFAGDQGREVFGVPGSIFSKASQGVHQLVRDGATLVGSADDILAELNLNAVEHQLEMLAMLPPQDPLEATVLAALSHEPRHIDEIVRETRLSVTVVSSTLTMLELKGMARQAGSMSYVVA